jgi:6-pyruvoyl-tetrahydropterin synthase
MTCGANCSQARQPGEPNGMMQACVTHTISCAHVGGPIRKHAMHGHDYQIEVWFTAGPDLDMAREAIGAVLQFIDHTQLEESIGGCRMEDIAAWVLPRVAIVNPLDVTRVVVARPLLGFRVEATP